MFVTFLFCRRYSQFNNCSNTNLNIYTQHQQFLFKLYLRVSKQFKCHWYWPMPPLQEMKPFIFSVELLLPDHVWRAPNPVSHSEARRWATVSIRCPLCKSQPRYIILWFICTSGRRRMSLRHAANVPAFVMSSILGFWQRCTQHSPARNTGERTERAESISLRSLLGQKDAFLFFALCVSHLHSYN